MRKLILFLLLFITTSAAVIAQKQTSVYCKMTIEEDIKFKQKIFVDFGSNNNLFKDSSITNNLIKARSLTNGIDAMNYMNSIGWDLITITAKSGIQYMCFYKRELEK